MITVDSTNCDPRLRLVRVDTASYLGVPAQLLPSQFTGTPPMFSANLVAQTNLVIGGNVGAINGGLAYWLRSSTNLALPLSQWRWVSTNVFNANGSFSNGLPIAPGTPQLFYRLQTQ
jgi:hypothetical protein